MIIHSGILNWRIHGVRKVFWVLCVVVVAYGGGVPFSPIKINFEYGVNYYHYKEMMMKDNGWGKEVFMNLTSSPVLHTFTLNLRRHIDYHWVNEGYATIILGDVDYESSSTGSASGEYNMIMVLENNLNYCLSNAVCMNMGYGFRYLNNDSTQLVTTTGSFGYKRENYLHFMPVGIKLDRAIGNHYIGSMQLRSKYYVFLDGRQVSHFEQFGCESDLKNRQNSGYGFEASMRFYNRDKRWYYGGQFQYWDIEASDSIRFTCIGANPAVSEPANTTTMAGVMVGYRF